MGEKRKGSSASLPHFGVWGDRSTLCFEFGVLLATSNFTSSLDARSFSSGICGEWPSRAAEGTECLAHLQPGKEKGGWGTAAFSLPLPNLP